ncbi:MAG: aldose 1-epimerase [Spirochaetes bacterium]|nr:aldose 1-epimerase [Spirochaetota bacterium]
MKRAPFIRHESWDGTPVIRFGSGGYEAIVVPSLGGMLASLTEVEHGVEILHRADRLETLLSRPKIYGIPTIFPPNRICDGKFKTDYCEYSLPINSPDGHHCHGLISGEPWDLLRAGIGPASAVVEVGYENLPGKEFYNTFQHDFVFKNSFSLSAEGLEHRYEVTNKGALPMPAGVGFHIAFNVPVRKDLPGEQVVLKASLGRRWELDDRSIPTGESLPLGCIENNYKFGGLPAAGFPIRDHYAAESIKLDGRGFHGAVLQDDKKGVRIIYQVGETFKHWMLWNEFGKTGFICPEPMTWMIDAPNMPLEPEISGYRLLGCGESMSDTSRIFVQYKRGDIW